MNTFHKNFPEVTKPPLDADWLDPSIIDELFPEQSATSIEDWINDHIDVTYREHKGPETDDNGKVYMIDGKLEPNCTYELNGYVYTTDEHGRIVSCEGKPTAEKAPRDVEAQSEAGGADRKPGDHGGHIIGSNLHGDGGPGNLVAMDGRINQSDYNQMENTVKKALEDGKDVSVKIECSYPEDSQRPDKITATVTIDGQETVYTFDNNLDGSLGEKIPESGKDVVQAVTDETGGTISSVVEHYDENGNLTEVTANILYTDEDGSNRHMVVSIDPNA